MSELKTNINPNYYYLPYIKLILKVWNLLKPCPIFNFLCKYSQIQKIFSTSTHFYFTSLRRTFLHQKDSNQQKDFLWCVNFLTWKNFKHDKHLYEIWSFELNVVKVQIQVMNCKCQKEGKSHEKRQDVRK